jgi:hypothetical protein
MLLFSQKFSQGKDFSLDESPSRLFDCMTCVLRPRGEQTPFSHSWMFQMMSFRVLVSLFCGWLIANAAFSQVAATPQPTTPPDGWTPDPSNDWRETPPATPVPELSLPPIPSPRPGTPPPGPLQAQPTGALSGIIVYCGAGHGLTADAEDGHPEDGDRGWYTQRPLLHGMIEDFGNIDQLTFFTAYALNAGATVVPTRPVGFQPNEVVLDNDDPGVTWSGVWKPSTSTIYYGNPGEVPYLYANTADGETAVARYTPHIPESGWYPVYAWARPGADRISQLYRIVHSGGVYEIRVNHRRVGRGWVWLGTHYFDAGDTGYVEISNAAPTSRSQPGVVIADAIRFGNGIGDVDRGTGPTGVPREFEASRYWVERMTGQNAPERVYDLDGVDDQGDNVGAPPRMAALMNRETDGSYWDRIYVSFHTNASGRQRGALGLFNGDHPTRQQREYATLVHDEVSNDMERLDEGVAFQGDWNDTGGTIYGGINYGEIRNTYLNGELTATILEVAYHDKPEDVALLLQPGFRRAVGRSTLQGIVRFLNRATDGRVPAANLPDSPGRVSAQSAAEGTVALAWESPAQSAIGGDPATGFIVYQSTDGHGYGPIRRIDNPAARTATVPGLKPGSLVYFQVSAVNNGGESIPSRPVAVRLPAHAPASVLLVDGVDRDNASLLPSITLAENLGSTKAGGGTAPILRAAMYASADALLAHADALQAAEIDFDSCHAEAVTADAAALQRYATVIWILSRDQGPGVNPAAEEPHLKAYLQNGGHLLVTGRALTWNIITPAELQQSYTYNLLPTSIGPQSQTALLQGGPGTVFDGLDPLKIDLSPGDVAGPGATPAPPDGRTLQAYTELMQGFAGVQGETPAYRLVNFGLPLQSIATPEARTEFMARILKFLRLPAAASSQ